MGRIYGEIKQTKAFGRLEQEAAVTLLRTADVLRGRTEAVLKPFGLSPEQYNVLRILRGAPGGILPTLEIAARMVSRAPNITRLIDKLLEKKLVTRCPSEDDRRVVQVRISREGVEKVAQATKVLDAAEIDSAAGLPAPRLRELIETLDAIRAAASKPG